MALTTCFHYISLLFGLYTIVLADCGTAIQLEDLEALNMTWVEPDKASNTSTGMLVPDERAAGQLPSTQSHYCGGQSVFNPENYGPDIFSAQALLLFDRQATGANGHSYPDIFQNVENLSPIVCDIAGYDGPYYEWPVKPTGGFCVVGRWPGPDRMILGVIEICVPNFPGPQKRRKSGFFCGFLTHRGMPYNGFRMCQVVPGTGAGP
ncbi:hypothetical protein LTR78_008382 [Recurvomyces mirabilis]|uniref:Uncharacterized protein n=1 Tax=Recurvomyces mirabilis TaxID=574656 RepID=A0AAE0TQ34_9PEZI|nr:hypothetical protein LTR78_008382 [Recurvomyces mirabilis]KAK5155369.1 hypothetical protein LTS14_005630 [Recurvomyces mirabilis]